MMWIRVAVSDTQMWAPASLLSRSFVPDTDKLPVLSIACSKGQAQAISDSLLSRALVGLEPEPGGRRLGVVSYQCKPPPINLFLKYAPNLPCYQMFILPFTAAATPHGATAIARTGCEDRRYSATIT